jgi:hypothetical protein
MILHAALMVAVFVDQLVQAAALVQCAPNAGQDPLGARLFLAALPSVFAIVIAWMVFRWNRNSDHRRWVLDSKKAEWKELLKFASAIEHFMPSVAIGSELINAVHDPIFKEHLREMTGAALSCLFISEIKSRDLYERLVDIRMTNEKSKGQIEDYNSNPSIAYQRGIPRPLQSAKQVQIELASLFRDVRRFASEDLELESREPWWVFFVNWTKRRHGREVDGNAPQDAPSDAA